MSRYLEMLKSGKRLPNDPPKPPNPHIDGLGGFGGYRGRYFFEIRGAANDPQAPLDGGLPRDPESGAAFTPYCVPMPADAAAAMLVEIRQAIDTLADAERWPDAHRAHLLDILRRQPAYTLADDLAHFRQRLDALQAAEQAIGVQVRCAMERVIQSTK
ncbi:hypothetical protein [Cupriavidus basilensis]|uniref:hypothetical protein n=1 Tax=Cupriavidus basilensis TaxID=68895 RepID=UPI00157AFE9B|nr:hypothetical protein [Cupriavidus basilensis]NUA28666.1 hypothetical protein [Cupriavidus basilensis]